MGRQPNSSASSKHLSLLKRFALLCQTLFSSSRVGFAKCSAEHFANPTLEEEKRVWHSKANLLRRDKCFELAEELGCLPIELALAYVLNKHPNIFPLVGPRSIYESESCMQASKINLSEGQLDWLIS